MKTHIGWAIALAITMAGCGGTASTPASPAAGEAQAPAPIVAANDQKSVTVKGAPSWVDNSGEGLGKPGDLFASGACDARRAKDRNLLKTAAQEDARAKLALAVKSRVSTLHKNFNRALSNLGDKQINESDIEQTSRSFADTTLTGVRFVESWKDPENGDVYVLAILPFDAGAAKELQEQIEARALKGASGQAHEELAKEIEKIKKDGWPK